MTDATVQPYVRGRWWGPLTVVVMVLPLAARVAPWPQLATALRYAQLFLVLTGIAVYVRNGIRMRRGVWTAQSWRRFLTSVAVSLVGVAIMLVFAAGVDNGWVQRGWIGERGSTLRMVVALSVITVGFVGAAMFAGALHRFAADPHRSQYESRLSRLWQRVRPAGVQ
jgi:hypothetical protein